MAPDCTTRFEIFTDLFLVQAEAGEHTSYDDWRKKMMSENALWGSDFELNLWALIHKTTVEIYTESSSGIWINVRGNTFPTGSDQAGQSVPILMIAHVNHGHFIALRKTESDDTLAAADTQATALIVSFNLLRVPNPV